MEDRNGHFQDPIEKGQIFSRIEEIIRGHTESGTKIPDFVEDGTFISTVKALLDAVENGSFNHGEHLCRVDYCLYDCESFFSCYETVEILCDLYLHVFRQLRQEHIDFFSSFGLSVNNLKNRQTEMWESYLYFLTNGGTGYFCFADELFQNVLDESYIGSIASTFSTDIKLALLILRSVLYFVPDGQRVSKLMFEMTGHITDCDQTVFCNVCMDEVYRSYRGSCGKTAVQYKNAENTFQADLAKQIIEKLTEEQEHQIIASSIPDLFSSSERYQIYRIADQERQSTLAKEYRKTSFLTQLFPSKTIKYGKRTAFIRYGANGEPYYQVSEFASFKYEHELPFLLIASPADWQESRIAVLGERSEYIASHHKGLSSDTEGERPTGSLAV